MSMQIPIDRILVAGPFGPQHIVNVRTNIPQELQQYVAQYALNLLNRAYQLVQTAASVGRVYHYNLMTLNGFNNPTLNRAVEVAFRVGWHLTVTKQSPSVDLAISVAVEKALSWSVAELILANFAQLGQNLRNEVVNSIRASQSEYATFNPQLMAITWRELNGAGVAVTTGNTVSGLVPPQGVQIGLSVNVGGANSNAAPSEWDQATLPASLPPVIDQSGFVSTTSIPGVQATPTPAPIGTDDLYSNVQPSNYGTSPQPVNQPLNPTPTPGSQPKVNWEQYYLPSQVQKTVYPSTTTTHKGLHEMDALLHSRAYFGNMEVSAQQSIVNFRGSSFRMAQDLLNNRPATERLTIGEIKLAMNVDDLFSQARYEHYRLGLQAGKPEAIARVLGVVMNPIIGSSVVEQLLPTIYSHNLRNIAADLKIAVDCKDPSRPTPQQHQNLISACYIDRVLGRAFNDFFARGLRSTSSLKMFSDSVNPAIEYVSTSSKHPPSHIVLLQDYINTLNDNLRNYGTPENIQSVKAGMLAEDDDHINTGLIVVPIAHTVTFCNLTTLELEWTTSYNGTDIDGKVTPTLFEICQTLRDDKKHYSFKSSYDWLLTGDGETFMLYENPDHPGMMRIFPVSGLNINTLKQPIS